MFAPVTLPEVLSRGGWGFGRCLTIAVTGAAVLCAAPESTAWLDLGDAASLLHRHGHHGDTKAFQFSSTNFARRSSSANEVYASLSAIPDGLPWAASSRQYRRRMERLLNS